VAIRPAKLSVAGSGITGRAMPPLIVGVYAVTCICGMLDAASFLGFGHVFVEIMTGNLVFLVFYIGTIGTHASSLLQNGVVPYVIAIGTFLIGATLGGRLTRLHGSLGEHRVGFAVEWVAIGVALSLTVVLHPGVFSASSYWVVGILSWAMGIQNAEIRRWGVPDLATNVMTLTMTALAAESLLGGGNSPRWVRRSTSVGIFAFSAGLGAFLVRYGTVWPIFIAFVIFTAALPVLLYGRDLR
jgi:uncharacterized membrane protein YoaK (UPF0700 family)